MKTARKYEFRVLGVAFLAMLFLFVWFTFAIFTKKFSDYDIVLLKSEKAGLQLPERADIKMRGRLVGEVQEVRASGSGVEIELGLYTDETDEIPSNVEAQILPKTLFGEKFVSLVIPTAAASDSIQAGDTIPEAEVAIEVERLLNDIKPLLDTIKPEELSMTLGSIAQALEGRGNTIGEGIETLNAYLKKENPRLPLLIEDVVKLGEVSATYNSIVPELATILRNTVTTGRTFRSQEDKIKALFADVADFSATTRSFLRDNGNNIIRLADLGARQLPLLARYSPEYPCLFDALAESIPSLESAFRDKTLHIVLETLPTQPRGYTAAEVPRYADKRGPFPFCDLLYDAIDGAYGQDNLVPRTLVPEINDGVNYPLVKRVAPAMTSGSAGTAGEQELVDSLIEASTGQRPATGVSALLFAPLARGMEVNLR